VANRELVLGIDLGTSYSSAGVLVQGGVEMVVDDGDMSIPSVVHIASRGDMVVGNRALPYTLSAPDTTITSVKRLLGIEPIASELKRVAAGVPYHLALFKDRLVITAHQREYTCEQVAAAILRRLVELAERRFGGGVRRAVVTIPAGVSRTYVASLQLAAGLAHLDIVQVAAEPIAGVLALGLHNRSAKRRLVVCDFGGGTFDVSCVAQDELRFEPVAEAMPVLASADDGIPIDIG
jgi:molecular chaperone DnaK (HSP70)